MTDPIAYGDLCALKILYMTPFPCWVKELSEHSEAQWRKKRIIEGGIKGLRIGQSPSRSGKGCAGFFIMAEIAVFFGYRKG